MIPRFNTPTSWLIPAAAVWIVNAVWLVRDTRPPVWDMAMHQAYALNYVEGPAEAATEWWRLSGNYPPFVHAVIALCYFVFHPGPRVAALANLPATLLLFWAIHGMGRFLASDKGARWAVWLAALTPYLIWMSRETVLDYWLSAWVCCSLLLLLRTRDFEARRPSLLAGAAMGMGMLTKWLFAGFVAVPLVLIAVRGRVWRDVRRAVNAADALLIAGIMAAVWYLPNLPVLARYFSENAAIGAREGEPPVLSLQSVIYYLRLLEGYQQFAILFAVTLAAGWYCWRRSLLRDGAFLAAAVGGGWLVMTLLRTKDPRFTMPLLGLLAVAAGAWVASWGAATWAKWVRAVLASCLLLQAYAVNFGFPWLPPRVVLLRGYQGSLRWDWNLYLQDYFGILGAPRRESWPQDDLLNRVREHASPGTAGRSLGLIPDLPRFNAANFLLRSRTLGLGLVVDHIQAEPSGIASFDGFDYVIMVEGNQGMPWTTGNSQQLNRIVVDEHEVFRLLGLYPLPDGDTARLYFVKRERRRTG